MVNVNNSNRLIEMVRSGVHHVLSAVKHEEFPQEELDASLHEAAWRGDLQCTRVLLAAGADVYTCGPQGETILVEAVHSGSVELVKHLIDGGFIIEFKPPSRSENRVMPSPLQIAIAKNNLQMIQILLQAGADPNEVDPDGDTPLICACLSGIAAELVPLFIEAKCDINGTGHGGVTALSHMAERGLLDIAKLLVDAQCDINKQSKNGYNPILEACESGNIEMVHYLLETGKCDLKLCTHEGNNALHLAALNGDIALVVPLVKAGVDINAREGCGNTPFIVAACVHNEQFGCELLEVCAEKIDINVQGYGGRTALHFACENSLNELTGLLLQREDLKPDLKDELGNTPLIQCAIESNNDLMQRLIKLECEVNIRGDKGLSPAHWCVLNRNAKGLKALLDITCLNTDIVDDEGNTPLLLGARNQCGLEMLMLLKEEADMDVQDKDGCTALHHLTMNGAQLFIPQFLKQGAKCDIPDRKGDTPLIYAIKYCEWQTMRELLKAGANVNHTGFKQKCPVHFLCQSKVTPSGSEEVLNALNDLFKAGAELEIPDENGNHPISLAAKQLNRDLVIKLMDLVSPNEINILDKDKKTLIYYFAQEGDFEVVLRLLKKGAEPDRDRSQSSTLIEAAKGGHVHVVTLLVSNGAIVDRKDHHRRTAVMWAAQMGHVDIIRVLIEHGAKAKRKDVSGDTALTLAAFHGHLEAVKMLIPLSDLNHKEKEEGMAALHLAISKDFSQCVIALLNAKADVSIVDLHNNNALLCAAIHTSGPIVLHEVLNSKQKYDINFQGQKGRTVLHWSVGDPDCVKLVLKFNPDLDILDNNGATPLLLAIAHGQPESAKLLINAGCDLYKMHSDGRCAIHHACIYGDAETVALLLKHNVSTDTLTKDGRSPLLLACIEGHGDCVNEILKYPCEINKVYFDAVTPFSVAASNSHYDIMETLLKAGADPDLIGQQKHSPLLACILNGDLHGMVILIQWGAKMDYGLEDNKHPLQVAAIKGHMDILKALASIEVDVNLIRHLLLDGAIYYFVENEEILSELEKMSKTPRPLHMICRQLVRKLLQKPVMLTISDLPVPNMVKSYLRMADLMTFLLDNSHTRLGRGDSMPSRGESYARDVDVSTEDSEDNVQSDPNVSEDDVSVTNSNGNNSPILAIGLDDIAQTKDMGPTGGFDCISATNTETEAPHLIENIKGASEKSGNNCQSDVKLPDTAKDLNNDGQQTLINSPVLSENRILANGSPVVVNDIELD